jgi:hypothetical protein
VEREAVEGAFDRDRATGGKFGTGVLWHDEKGPGAVLFALRRPQELCFETDVRSGFSHWLVITVSPLFGKQRGIWKPENQERHTRSDNFQNTDSGHLSRFFTFESAAVAWADAKEFVFPEAAIRLPITADPAPCDRERRDPSQEQNPWTVRPAARIRLRRVPFATSL